MNDHLLPQRYRQSQKPAIFSTHYQRIAQKLDTLHRHLQPPLPTSSVPSPIRMVCISDTHNSKPTIPSGDLLVHAGDLTQHGSFTELQDQLDWLSSQPHRFKVVIAGNHDTLLDAEFAELFSTRATEEPGASRADLIWRDIVYLQDSAAVLELANSRRLKVYGSARTPEFGTWAFQYPPIRDVWTGRIPDDADVIVVHGPPALHCDVSRKGDWYLLREVRRVMPKVVVCGHIHDGYGQDVLLHDGVEGAREDVELQCRGLLTIIRMCFWILISWLRALAGVSNLRATRIVNAAVAPGAQGQKTKAPIVVTI